MILATKLNEALKELLPVAGGELSKAASTALVQPYLVAGAVGDFTAGDVTEDWFRLFDRKAGMLTPFPRFRFCWYTQSEMVGGFVVNRGDAVDCLMINWKSPVRWAFCFRWGKDLEWYRHLSEKVPSDSILAKGVTACSLVILLEIALQFMAPFNFVVRVTPDKASKSVAWCMAREHYVTLHRRHAANSARVAHGAVVAEYRNVERQAHSRRAHFRILKSLRYKRKVGTRLFIRSTWVGPQEWRDTAGQIYRIATLKPAGARVIACGKGGGHE